MSDLSQLTRLKDRLFNASSKVRGEVTDEMDKAAEQVQMKMREFVAVDTGHLRDSIAVVKQGSNHWTIGPVGVPYAAAQEFGAKPHVIIAGPGKVLAFQVGGQQRFAKSVKHPGNQPHPYIQPAKEWARDNLNEKIAVIGTSLLEGE